MAPARSLILAILVNLTIVAALPARDSTLRLSKRTSSGRKAGTGIAIAIAVILFAAIIFYLGMRRGQTGTWYCWRDPPSTSSSSPITSISEKEPPPQPRDLKDTIGFPQLQRCTVPIELSPVEAKPKPTFLELPGESHVHELGAPRSWFEEKKRSWFGGRERRNGSSSDAHPLPVTPKRSLYEMDAEPIHPPAYQLASNAAHRPRFPPALFLRESVGDSEGGMDWSGIEYLKKMYTERKSVYRPGT